VEGRAFLLLLLLTVGVGELGTQAEVCALTSHLLEIGRVWSFPAFLRDWSVKCGDGQMIMQLRQSLGVVRVCDL
jgi:hypothetical protein